MAAKLFISSWSLLLIAVAALWCMPLLPATTSAENTTTVQPAASLPATGKYSQTTTATLPQPSPSSSAAAAVPPEKPAVAVQPEKPAAAAAASETAGTAAATTTTTKKFPQPQPTYGGGGGGGEPYLPGPGGAAAGEQYPYLPAAEVASALPIPTPEEIPSAASLGFGSNGFGGPGDECCGGAGGYGWFGGPGGFGPGTYGYSGPLYWGAAPATMLGRLTNVVLPLVVAYVYAAIFG